MTVVNILLCLHLTLKAASLVCILFNLIETTVEFLLLSENAKRYYSKAQNIFFLVALHTMAGFVIDEQRNNKF